MKVIYPGENILEKEPSVVTVGNFDGLHKGHAELLNTVSKRAKDRGLRSVVITFLPHTRAVVGEEKNLPILSTFEEKIILLEKFDIDLLICLDFTVELAGKSPDYFVKNILEDQVGVVEWVMGANHSFGKNAIGSKKFLQKEPGKYHISMFVVDLSTGDSGVVSSTKIREAVCAGRMEDTKKMLGHPYLLLVERVRGLRKGTELGYPTLNFKRPVDSKIIPPFGVYAAKLQYNHAELCGALYFGNCPTFGNRDYHFEFYSFDNFTEGEVPGVASRAVLLVEKFIRKDREFSSSEVLVSNIKEDVENIKRYFAED